MIGYLLTSMMVANGGRVVPNGLMAMAERSQDEEDSQAMRGKISAKIKEVRAAQKKEQQKDQVDNGTQVFADMADSAFQTSQMEIATDSIYQAGQNRLNDAMLSSPLGSPIGLLSKYGGGQPGIIA